MREKFPRKARKEQRSRGANDQSFRAPIHSVNSDIRAIWCASLRLPPDSEIHRRGFLCLSRLRRRHSEHHLSAADADGDGQNNRAEFLAGTNPNNPTQFLRATSVSRSGSDLIVVFSGTVAGHSYQLQSSSDLVAWANNGTSITATGSALTLAIPFGLEGRRVHRLRALYTFP